MKNLTMKMLLIVFCLSATTACVTEGHRGLFHEPTKEDLQRAIDIYVQMVYLAIDQKNYEQAMKSSHDALDIDAHSAKALTALANTYAAQGDNDKAADTFEDAISADRKFTRARMDYGRFLYQQKKNKQACEQFRRATEDDFYSDRAVVYFNLGVCERSIKEEPEAEEAFQRASAIDPHFAAAQFEIALLRFDQKKYPESKKYFDDYVKLMKDQNAVLPAKSLWLGIRLERIFGNKDAEASYAVFLKNTYPYSEEYLEYKKSLEQQQ